MMTDEQYMNRKCRHCGFTYGSHHGGTNPWPRNYCPGHEGRMDWENGPGTVFEEEKRWIIVDRNYKILASDLSLDLAWSHVESIGGAFTVISEEEYNRLKDKEE